MAINALHDAVNISAMELPNNEDESALANVTKANFIDMPSPRVAKSPHPFECH